MAFYTILLGNSGYDISALKATTTPTTGTNWSEQDGSVRVETGGGKVVSMWVDPDSSDLHVATQQADGRVRYHVFDPGTDSWTTKNEYVVTVGDTNFDAVPASHAVSLALRSDGDVVLVAAYNDGSNETLRLFIKTTTWANQAEATAGTASTDYTGVSVVGPDSSDRISWAYLDTTNDDVDLQSVDSGTTLGTVTEIDSAVDTASLIVAPGVIDSANKIYMPYIDFSNKISVGSWTSGATPTVSVDTDVSDNNLMGYGVSLGAGVWRSRSAEDNNSWLDVTFGGGIFVAVSTDGTNRVMTSPDGISWTARSASQVNQWFAVIHGDGTFVATSFDGTNRVMTSTDGISWTNRSASQANQWRGLAHGDGLFVAVSNVGTNRVMTSPTGETWTNRTASDANEWIQVTYGNGIFVAVAITGTDRVMTSPDGITWTGQTASQANPWRGVAYGNGIFVAVASSGTNQVMTSSDGINWVNRTATETNFWRYVSFGEGLFVAIASDGTNQVMTSPDGIAWTARGAPEDNSWRAIAFKNGVFVGVGVLNLGSDTVMTSHTNTFAVASLAVKTDDVHLLYVDDATQDIFHDDDVDGGGTTDVERNDAVTADRLSCKYLSSSDVLAWLYLDGTTTVYDEFSLAAAPTGLPVGSLSLLGVGL